MQALPELRCQDCQPKIPFHFHDALTVSVPGVGADACCPPRDVYFGSAREGKEIPGKVPKLSFFYSQDAQIHVCTLIRGKWLAKHRLPSRNGKNREPEGRGFRFILLD